MTPADTPLNRAIETLDPSSVRQALAALGTQAPTVLNHLSDDKAHVPPLTQAARRGHQGIAALLLDAGADVDVRDALGRTPLFRAYAAGELAMAAFLTARGADIRAKNADGSRIFDIALTCCDVAAAQSFMAAGEALQHANEKGTSTLHRACAAGPELVAFVLDHTDFRLDQKNRQGLRPVEFARRLDVLQLALRRQPGLALNIRLPSGDWSIHRFAKEGALDIVAHLLDQGVDLSLPSRDGGSILHQAVASGNLALARLLLDRGAALEARNVANHRPLHWAASSGRLDMVRLLVEHGAKLDVKTNKNFIIIETHTPLYLAIEGGHGDVASYLVEQGASVDEACDASNRTALTAACFSNQVDLVRLLLARGASPNGIKDQRSGYDMFPLAMACGAETVDALVRAGADVRATNQQRETALHQLAKLPADRLQSAWGQGVLAAIRALLAHGADAAAQDEHRWTPLANARTPAVAELLLSALPRTGPWREHHGKELFERARNCTEPAELDLFMALLAHATPAEINFSARDGGETILHRLVENAGSTRDEAAPVDAFRRAIEWLVRNGARLDAVEGFHFDTPLHAVCRAGMSRCRSDGDAADWLALAELMLDHGADVNATNKYGSTPLDLVQRPPLLQALKARGARFGALNEAVFEASARGGFDVVDLLLAQGAGLETQHARFEGGDTPLLNAARRNGVPALRALLARGARREARNAQGMTALHVACAAGAFAAIRELAAPGAAEQLDARDAQGRTPLGLLLSFEAPRGDKEARKEQDDTALWLVESGAGLDIQDQAGRTPLSHASTKKLAAALRQKAKRGR